MKITAVRHGETIENAAGIVQGQTYGTLSDKGREQIRKLSEKLKDQAFDIIYCSDLERCVETAAAITQFHRDTKVVYDKRLRERKLEPLEGKSFAELGWSHGEVHDLDLKTSEGESWQDVESRLKTFIEYIRLQPEQRVLFVMHGGPLRVLDSILTDQPLEETIHNFYDNCAIREWSV